LVDRYAEKEKGPLILEAIGISHYSEKVRWILDYLKIPYVEEQDVGILGVILFGKMVTKLSRNTLTNFCHNIKVPAIRVPGRPFRIENSSDILRYLYGSHYSDPECERVLRPSQDALELEQKLDRLGLRNRVFFYTNAFLVRPSQDMALIDSISFRTRIMETEF